MQDVRFIVSASPFKQGFCPTTYDQLLAAIVENMSVTPNQDYSTFGQGNVLPSSNQGPFLKDGLEWYVFDDDFGGYRPQIQPIDATTGSNDAGKIIKTATSGFLDPSFLNFIVHEKMAADQAAGTTYGNLISATTTQKTGKVYIIGIAQAIKTDTGDADGFPVGIRISSGGTSISGNIVNIKGYGGGTSGRAATIVSIAQDVLSGSTKTYALEGQADVGGKITFGATGVYTETQDFNYVNATSITLLQTGA